MLSPQTVYPVVLSWLEVLGIGGCRTGRAALAQVVVALLRVQSVRSSALMRALLSPCAVPARQRYKRVARTWDRPWLTSGWLTPRLVRAVTTLLPARGLTHLALDSVRCGCWEVVVLGVVVQGRVLPVAWSVVPYPWPTGQLTRAVTTLLSQVAACWPDGHPVHLVADRGFPGQRFFRTLRALGWGWTVRLRANTGVEVGNEALLARTLVARARPHRWTAWQGSYGRGAKAIPATLVVGRGLVVVPRHRRTAASQWRQARRRADRLRKCRQEYAVEETDTWLILCTTHATWREAATSYRRRWAIEGSFRDAQGGWDGRHGWDLEPVLTRTATAGQVERIVGLWALGSLLQTWIGSQVAHGPAPVRAALQGWTTTGRLSIWTRGQCALADPNAQMAAWVIQSLQDGAARLQQPNPAYARQPALTAA